MDNTDEERLKRQVDNFDSDAMKELKDVLNDYNKFMEFINLIKKHPISIEDKNQGQISLQSSEELYKLKDLILIYSDKE